MACTLKTKPFTPSQVQSVAFVPSGPLEWNIEWTEEAGVSQTYTLIIRDIPGRTSTPKPQTPNPKPYTTQTKTPNPTP